MENSLNNVFFKSPLSGSLEKDIHKLKVFNCKYDTKLSHFVSVLVLTLITTNSEDIIK